MWHVGIHVWEVPWNELEPNYDDYYVVGTSIRLQTSHILTVAGKSVVQPPQPSDSTTRQSIDYPSSSPSRLSHRMAQACPLRYFDLHYWKRTDTLVSLHFCLSTSDRQHLEATNIRQPALHGPSQDGRNAPLGYMRQPPYRSSDLANSFYHRPKDDERSIAITIGGVGCLHLQSRSDLNRCCKDLLDVSRSSIFPLQAGLDLSDRLLHQPYREQRRDYRRQHSNPTWPRHTMGVQFSYQGYTAGTRARDPGKLAMEYFEFE
jgi:hypothetical protein